MFRLPSLPYAADALAPTISEATMRTHHGKHHATYVETTNVLVGARGETFDSLEAVVRAAARDGDQKLFNNAAQAWNHAFFWWCMSPVGGPPVGRLRQAIDSMFGDLGALKAAFVKEGGGHFGSGWVWLIADRGALSIRTTHDAATPLTGAGTPLLVCDLWEHAYYLDHKNDRAAYLGGWWDRLVNWAFVAGQYDAARNGEQSWSFADAEHLEPAA